MDLKNNNLKSKKKSYLNVICKNKFCKSCPKLLNKDLVCKIINPYQNKEIKDMSKDYLSTNSLNNLLENICIEK